MRKLFFLSLLFCTAIARAQLSYDAKMEKLAGDIASSFKTQEKVKIGICTLSYNDNETKLTRLVYDDLSAALVSLSNNQTKIIVSGESILDNVAGFHDAESETDKALVLNKEKNIEYLLTGKISDYDSGYKIQLRLYDTKDGNLVSAFKTIIDKSSQFMALNDELVADHSRDIVQTIPPATPPATPEEPVKVKKEKVKKENKFWKFLGETALNTGAQVVNTTLERKLSQSGSSSSGTSNQTPSGNQQGTQTQSGSQTQSGNPTQSGTSSPTDPTQADPSADCRVYVNITNKTENTISVKVYKENPVQTYGARILYSFTIAPGKSKKQKIEKDVLYYYLASNNTGSPVIGSYRDWDGTFEAENCNETVGEDVE